MSRYPTNIRNLNDEGGISLRHADYIIQYVYQMVHGTETPFMGSVLLVVLRFFSYLYEFGVCSKLWLYTVGGTGKTPTAQKVAAMIKSMGYNVVILNRGYRSHWDKELGVVSDGKKIFMTAYEAGDEAYLMAKTLPGIPVIIGKNRAVTGQFAVDKMKAEVIIMDDGYQHWHLYRDLDVVLVDTYNMFGNGCLLPRHCASR